MIRRRLALVAMFLSVLFLSVATASAAPLELATDAERTWRELRNSDDVKTKLMADRWYGAIKLQEWSDASGKFKTTAKYVGHDPNLAWVKLRVIQGVGDKRVVKDVTIPLEKLNKAGQARVRQISVLSEKVAEAVAEEQKKETEDETDGEARGGEMQDEQALAEDPRGGRGQYDAGLAGMDAEQAIVEGNDPGGSRDPRQSRDPRMNLQSESAAGSEPAGVPSGVSADPLPAMLPPLPTGAAQAADGSSPAQTTASDQTAPPNFPDNDPWRTSYDAFRANIIVQDRGRSGLYVEWGTLQALKQAQELHKQFSDTGSVSPENIEEIEKLLVAVGEFSWEATLTQTADQAGDWTAPLGLPPLPAPFELTFVLDSERDPGRWQSLEAGDQVRFIGRFTHIDDDYGLVAAIRFPEEASINGSDQRPAETDRRAAAPPQDDRGR